MLLCMCMSSEEQTYFFTRIDWGISVGQNERTSVYPTNLLYTEVVRSKAAPATSARPRRPERYMADQSIYVSQHNIYMHVVYFMRGGTRRENNDENATRQRTCGSPLLVCRVTRKRYVNKKRLLFVRGHVLRYASHI